MMERDNEFGKVVDIVYWYLDCDDLDLQKQRLKTVMEFVVGLYQSWVDNDKPKVPADNRYINELLIAEAKWVDL